MNDLRWSSKVQRVTVIRAGQNGALEPTLLYKKRDKKKKKQAQLLAPIERTGRRIVVAQRVFWDTLSSRHDRSNRKRSNGWVRDAVPNLAIAYGKGARRFTRGLI
jgi:uncharacterized protein DUF6312